MSILDWWKDRKHNRELYRTGRADKNIVVETAVGYRPLLNGKPDTRYKKVHGATASGNVEYTRVVRKK
jgi:hypothetical protein